MDVLCQHSGSLVIFEPQNEEARAWIDENVETEPWQWMGLCLVVDWLYAGDLYEGLWDAGFVVEGY